jgi:pimeloyl-ACP methyl ester carboxylesterase
VKAPEAPHPSFVVKVSGAGRPVVFLPDLQAPGDVWDTTVVHLGGRVEAHVVSVAGFAGLPAAAEGGATPVLPRLRAELARYLRDRGARDAVLVGHMFGATVAYSLALSDPDLVGGVVAVDAPPTVADGDPKDVAAEAEEGRRALANAPPAEFAEMAEHRLKSMVASPEVGASLSAQAARSSPATVGEAFYDMMTLDLRPRLGEMKPRVLVIATMGNREGESRAEVEARWGAQIDRIPRHRLVVIPESRHYVMFDAPGAFFAELDRFLAG